MAGQGRDEDEAYEAPEAPAEAPAGAGTLAQWRIPLVGLLIGVGLGVVFGAHLNAALAEPPEPALGNGDADAGAEAVPA